MKRLIPVNNEENIPSIYLDSPIGDLLRYHNMGKPYESYAQAKILIGMCMDSRKHLIIPDNFAYIIRSGGANLRQSEFRVSYAIAVGDVRCIVLIGHNNCGMVNLQARKEDFINGLMEKAGWSRDHAESHFIRYEPENEIRNEVDFILIEAKRLRMAYPKIVVAPMFYVVEDNRLYLIKEE